MTGAHDALHGSVLGTVPNRAYGWNPMKEQMRDDNRARLRQVLGGDELERAYAAGKALSLEQAVHLALGRVRFAWPVRGDLDS